MTNEPTTTLVPMSDEELAARISGLRTDIALSEQNDRPGGNSRTATLRAHLDELEAELAARQS